MRSGGRGFTFGFAAVDGVDDFEGVGGGDVVVVGGVEEAEGKADGGVLGNFAGAEAVDVVDDGQSVAWRDGIVGGVVGAAVDIQRLNVIVPGVANHDAGR